jgi:hypothetical protein
VVGGGYSLLVCDQRGDYGVGEKSEGEVISYTVSRHEYIMTSVTNCASLG